MNSIFGDATTIAPTPEQHAEVESLFSGNRSPVPSFRLGGEDQQVPDMDLVAPPEVEIQNGKPVLGKDGEEGEGVSGWISGLVKRTKGEEGGSGKYKPVGQEDRDG